MKKILISLVLLSSFSTALFSQLTGFDYYGKQYGIEIWTKKNDSDGMLSVKFKNDSNSKKSGDIKVEWYESNGSKCTKSETGFTAFPGVSGGYMEGSFYYAHDCQCQKLTGAYACGFKITLSDVE